MSDIYENIFASLVKFTQDFIAENASISPDVDFVNWDAHASLNMLPNKDLIGFGNLGVNTDDAFHHIEVSFGVSTVDDLNLFRHVKLISKLHSKLLPEKQIPLIAADDGRDLGVMIVVDNTDVLPVAKTETRPIQFIMVSLESTVTSDRG